MKKCRTVEKELHNRSWIRTLINISTPEQLSQFVKLWSILRRSRFSPLQTPSHGGGQAQEYTRRSQLTMPIDEAVAPFRTDKAVQGAPFRTDKAVQGEDGAKVSVLHLVGAAND
jgi:hypothetical protein